MEVELEEYVKELAHEVKVEAEVVEWALKSIRSSMRYSQAETLDWHWKRMGLQGLETDESIKAKNSIFHTCKLLDHPKRPNDALNLS